MPPRREASHEAIVYFILFLLMGVMFPLYTMFGVLLNSLRKKGVRSVILSIFQKVSISKTINFDRLSGFTY